MRSLDVHPWGDCFQVGRIHTRLVLAQVIQLQSRRHGTVHLRPLMPMRLPGLPRNLDLPIPLGVRVSHPDPTAGFGFNAVRFLAHGLTMIRRTMSVKVATGVAANFAPVGPRLSRNRRRLATSAQAKPGRVCTSKTFAIRNPAMVLGAQQASARGTMPRRSGSAVNACVIDGRVGSHWLLPATSAKAGGVSAPPGALLPPLYSERRPQG